MDHIVERSPNGLRGFRVQAPLVVVDVNANRHRDARLGS
ncbi:hypothetical protein RJ639_002959 [Escallonia herrerae]|uniref:Uncharacterized protein n=1 Tax=Escallonia herrerae TaxID=1293975 RepID=A0AA89AYH1_9ASTE|nr:hypothetical protein RJ639_002959 [Escallonia herrerae]